MQTADVLIVGGGPAGAACARTLKDRGVDCLILDRQTFPRSKLCAGWVPPGVWRDLEIRPEQYPHGLKTFDRLYVTIKGVSVGVPTLQYAIRRIEFDDWLLKRAGMDVVMHQVHKVEKTAEGFRVDDTYESRYIVGAGGTHCPVYRELFSKRYPRSYDDLIVTQEQEFQYPYLDQRCQLWFVEEGLPGYAWYVPKANGYVNVGVGGKVARLKKNGDHIQRHWAVLVDKLKRRDIVTQFQYHPTGHAYYLRGVKGPVQLDGAYLVGDAAALATRDLGEGIDVGIKSGIRAANAIINGTPYTVEDIRQRTLGYEWLRLPWIK